MFENQNFYGAVLENLPIPVVILDSNGNVKEVNYEAEQLIEETTNLPYGINNNTYDTIINLFQKELKRFKHEHQDEQSFEKKIYDKYFEIKLKKILIESKDEENIIILLNDVTTRKKVEDLICHSEQNMREILESMEELLN